jgi:hypothetical protein
VPIDIPASHADHTDLGLQNVEEYGFTRVLTAMVSHLQDIDLSQTGQQIALRVEPDIPRQQSTTLPISKLQDQSAVVIVLAITRDRQKARIIDLRRCLDTSTQRSCRPKQLPEALLSSAGGSRDPQLFDLDGLQHRK